MTKKLDFNQIHKKAIDAHLSLAFHAAIDGTGEPVRKLAVKGKVRDIHAFDLELERLGFRTIEISENQNIGLAGRPFLSKCFHHSKGKAERTLYRSKDESEQSSVNLWIEVADAVTYEGVTQLVSTMLDTRGDHASVHVLMAGSMGGIEIRPLGVAAKPLIRENYSAEVLTSFDYIASQLMEKEPRGRIAIFEGEPGTGKTHAIRALMDAVSGSATFLLIPPEFASSLAGPSFIESLSDLRGDTESPLVIIVEDADSLLVPREDNNPAVISAVLNLTDGILGNLLDIRIVVTTNANRLEIDKAILRPGRLMEMTHVGPLSAAEANAAFKRLTGIEGDFTKPTTLAEVYHASNGSRDIGSLRPTSNKMGF